MTACNVAIALLIAPLLIGYAQADSVTTSDNLATNGRVVNLDGRRLVIQCRFFKAGKETSSELQIPRQDLLKIEFNNTTFNPGGPPAIGLRPGGPKDSENSAAASNLLVLRGGDIRRCDSISIQNESVQCSHKAYDRSLIVRIEFKKQ